VGFQSGKGAIQQRANRADKPWHASRFEGGQPGLGFWTDLKARADGRGSPLWRRHVVVIETGCLGEKVSACSYVMAEGQAL
jgi:hypothetical protein